MKKIKKKKRRSDIKVMTREATDLTPFIEPVMS